MSTNVIVVSGRLVRDPETRFVEVKGEQTQVTNFTVASDNGFGDSKTTDFFDVAVWRHTAKFVAEYIKKGREVTVTGSHNSRKWEKDGKKGINWTINATNVDAHGPKPEEDTVPGDDLVDPFADVNTDHTN